MRNGPYELVIAPVDYPGKRYRDRYCYEHHLVWWQNTGRVLTDGKLIHHKNGEKRDNRFENLEEVDWGEHTREHAKDRNTDVEVNCASCGTQFQVAGRNYRFKRKRGQTQFYCCRPCQHEGLRKHSRARNAGDAA